jgi:hypothetical protein
LKRIAKGKVFMRKLYKEDSTMKGGCGYLDVKLPQE